MPEEANMVAHGRSPGRYSLQTIMDLLCPHGTVDSAGNLGLVEV